MATHTIGFEKMGVDLDKLTAQGYTTCPECSENRKQANKNKKVFRLSLESGHYTCNHCGIKGRVDSDQWIEEQHQKQNLPTPPSKPKSLPQKKEALKNKRPFTKRPLTAQGLEYLQSRGISKKTAAFLKLAEERGHIAFNYYEDRKIVGAKYRKIGEKKFWQHPYCKKTLYNIDSVKGKQEVIFVEGEFDVASLVEVGFANSVSVSQGAPNAGSEVGSKLDCLNGSSGHLKVIKRVIIFTDQDANGRYLEKILIERFGTDRCAIVKVPKELIDPTTEKPCKDANAVLVHYGKHQLKKLIERAENVPIAGVRTLREVEGEMWDIYNNGYKQGVSTGMKCLDGHFSFYKPWWNLWYGIPGSGKSEFILFLMMSMAVNNGWKWGCFVPEAYPATDFYNDCVIKLTGRRFEAGNENRLDKEEYQAALDFIHEHFFFIYPQDGKNAKGEYLRNNFENVVSKIKELKLSKGIDGFLIDPINQLSASDSFGGTKDERLEVMYERLDVLCKTHSLSGNLVAHPRTLYKDKDTDDYKAPTPYEIAGGAMNYNKAYCITCIHRPFNQTDKGNTMVHIDVQKIKRHRVAGKPACITVNYNPFSSWYKSTDTPRGFGALEGAFNQKIMKRETKEPTPFTDKITTGLDPFGDPLPF